ncbi:MAG: hypothetical protein IJS93_01445 [Clostridia bacterium]|nr:hypothetical protein [Clostridia bacterium]
MCIFGKKDNSSKETVKVESPAANTSANSATFRFDYLPKTLADMQALPEASMDTPFKTAALTVCALCAYGEDRSAGLEMLNWLRGPYQQPMSQGEIQFLNDRFRDGQKYVAYSYFNGAKPENEYTPSAPFTITITANQYSYQDGGYCNLWLRSGGADSPRNIKMRRANDVWYLLEQCVMVGIRQPKSQNPWG